MKKYSIHCLAAGLIFGEGDTKEEALSKVPEICEECNGKVDFSTLRWNGYNGSINCSIGQRLEKIEAHALNQKIMKKIDEFKSRVKKELR